MKKLVLGLFAVVAIALSANTSEGAVKVKSTTTITTATPPNGYYRIGEFHRRVPRRAARVIVNGNVYYQYRGSFFQPTRRGFVVVQRPRVHRPNYSRNYNRGYRQGYNRGSGRNYGNSRYGSPYNRGGCRR